MRQPPVITKIGVPKEIKDREYRVGLIPVAAAEYIALGATVYIEASAGEGSGFTDKNYEAVGCKIVQTPDEVYALSELIIKVKEPLPPEYSLVREGQIIFTYFHFASNHSLTEAMIKAKAICVAYETVETSDHTLPLLTPMSEIAGRMAVQEGAKYLERQYGGSGVLLSGAPGVLPGRVLILGGGMVGQNAARIAAGMGAQVIILDINVSLLRKLEVELPRNCQTLFSNRENLLKELKQADVVIGAVLVVGAPSPILVYKDDLELMKPGSVIIDVAVDQGGCIATCKPMNHDNPFFVLKDILHYCVTNMPGAVPNTSTTALNNVTIKYGKMMVSKGWKAAMAESLELQKGANIIMGKVTCKPVAEWFNAPFVPITSLL